MSSPEPTSDQRVALKIGSHPDQVSHARTRFNTEADGAIIRAVLADRLQQQLDEQLRKLRSVKPDELATIQGRCDAIELAIGTVSQPLQ